MAAFVDADSATTKDALAAVAKAKRVFMFLHGVETGAVKIAKQEATAMLRAHLQDEAMHREDSEDHEYRWQLLWDADWLTISIDRA